MKVDMETTTVIKSDQTVQDMVTAMAGGNPGALRVCMDILNRSSGFGLMN